MLEPAACGDLAELAEDVIDAVRAARAPAQAHRREALLGALEALGSCRRSPGDEAGARARDREGDPPRSAR